MADTFTLAVRRGATFRQVLAWQDPAGQPVSVENYRAQMQVRRRASDPVVLLELTSDLASPAHRANANLSVAGNEVTIYLGATATEALVETFKTGVYDLELHSLTDPDDVQVLIAGAVTVTGQVTR